ncbi:DUF6916 family protein [Nocardioides sp. SYSU DS0663]|uniref:DUF6916 family protein n=1 Tax=Nocardioides sp. SYSU DS0663 TaxID=3416445 RepID=UPI003F4B2DE7
MLEHESNTLDDHRSMIGRDVEVLTADGRTVTTLRVDAVHDRGDDGSGHRTHAVELSAPAEPALGQDTYAVRWPGGQEGWLFVVPTGQHGGRLTFEAVFSQAVST